MLEGGYDREAIAWGVRGVLGLLLGDPPQPDPVGPAPLAAPIPDVGPIIAAARALHGL